MLNSKVFIFYSSTFRVEPLITGISFSDPVLLGRFLDIKHLFSYGSQTSKHWSQTTRHCSQTISHHWHVTAGAVLYYVQVNNFVSWVSSLLTGGLNCCFHKNLVYPAKSFSGLGLVLMGPVMKSLTVMKFLTWYTHQSSFFIFKVL